MELPGKLGLLTYCSNIHPGETWPELQTMLEHHVPQVKARVAPDRPMGVGLRIAAVAAEALAAPEALAELCAILARHDLFVFTINGFPYGPFHGTRVKEQVYQPDWQHDARLVYTNRLADLLAALLPEGGFGSLSTVPGTFKPLAAGHEAAMAERILRQVAHDVALAERTGRTVALALEPEPFCFLETIAETVAFFEHHLFDERAVARLAALTGQSRSQAATALPRHLGVCYDVCHAAVEYEDPDASLDALEAAGIPIHKLQLSAALRVPAVDAAARAALAPFAEPTYLHQVLARDRSGSVRGQLDLPAALALGASSDGEEWRIHFHVPIFQAELERFATTQPFLDAVLARHARQPLTPHLEVETYTFDVLPEAFRGVPVDEAIARELNWVRSRLSA
ncbi:MAG: sugar phosphate isomerase [Geminicoccaceae bacterium]|nr:MAG: sugar phosphate isomerase [Geminicoccaceae bacterium]